MKTALNKAVKTLAALCAAILVVVFAISGTMLSASAANQPPLNGADPQLRYTALMFDRFVANYGVLNNEIAYPYYTVFANGFTTSETVQFPIYYSSGSNVASISASVGFAGSTRTLYTAPTDNDTISFELHNSRPFVCSYDALELFMSEFTVVDNNPGAGYRVDFSIDCSVPAFDPNGEPILVDTSDSVTRVFYSQNFDEPELAPFGSVTLLPYLWHALHDFEYTQPNFIVNSVSLSVTVVGNGNISSQQFTIPYVDSVPSMDDFYLEYAVGSPYVVYQMPVAGWIDWIGQVADSFLSFEFGPDFSFGDVLMVYVGASVFFLIIKIMV